MSTRILGRARATRFLDAAGTTRGLAFLAALILAAPDTVAQEGPAAPGELSCAPTRRAALDEVPEGLTSSDWASIRAAWDGGRYAAQPVDGGHRAANPGQQWTTLFDGRGFLTTPDSGGWSWGLDLLRYGREGDECAVTQPEATAAASGRVAYDWDGRLTEWYRNDQRGLEHGYTLAARPTGPGGPLTLALAIRGDLRPVVSPDGRDVRFVDDAGGTVVTYAGLSVLDADGRALAAGWRTQADELQLQVDDRSARYPLTIDPIAQQAYLKASNTGVNDQFGFSVALSGDTVVVGAFREDSNAMGVDGDGTDDSAPGAGAAYVFVRAGTSWSSQAYLKASNTGAGDRFGQALAIAGDTLVVGAPLEDSDATGVNGDGTNDSASGAGAAYVFVRNGTTWSQQAYLKASNTGASDSFGWSVSVDGDTVAVGAFLEDSSATGVDGDGTDDGASSAGAAYVFARAGTTWSQQAYLKASNTDADDHFGQSVAVDGDTVVVGATLEDSSATGVNGDGSNDAASGSGAAYVFVRGGTTWSQQAYVKASNTGADDSFGQSVGVSADTLVVGAVGEDSSATGVDGDGADNGASFSGAAYVFVRGGTNWSQQAYLKASNTGVSDAFGQSVSVDRGRVAVGAPFEDSSATGVDGDGSDDTFSASGAAYVFLRSGTSWSQQAYLKASNTGVADNFGASVAVDADRLVVGAPNEASGATGVGGDQANDRTPASGAGYLFELGPWTDLGGGTTGVSGQPLLTLSGPLTSLSLLTLDLVDGAPSSLAILFVSLGSTPTAFLGGTLHAFPISELVVLGTDGAGELHGSIVFPSLPSGTGLWFQVGIADASVPIHGASLSNGVQGTVP